MRDNRGMRRVLGAVAGVLLLAGACAYTPDRIEVAPPVDAQSSSIYAADGTLITTLHAEENRENVPLSKIPKVLQDAVIAIEDSRFWYHKGVDVKAVIRAAAANASEGAIVEGGSTLTQQYVKNTLLDDEQSIDRKVKEALLAVEMERTYTKERILELYLNTIYFGNGAYGVEAAAREYFGKPASALDLPQASLLAALIRRPSLTDPYDYPERAVARRRLVLDRMADLGWITREDEKEAGDQPLELTVKAPDDRYPAAYFVEQVKQQILDDERFGATRGERQQLLFAGGLRIYTTVDLAKQAQAEEAIARVLPDPERDPDAALVSIEPATGYVRTLVGGRDFFGGGAQAKLDLATGGPGRPSGSSFKPLVLAEAIEKGIPLDKVYPAPSRIEIPLTDDVWKVQNYEGSGGGEATLLESTVRSYNTVYAQLIMEVGPADAMSMAARLGIRSPLQPYPSAVLGTNLVHPIDMANAYATFARRGLRVDPVFITKVVRPDGTVLFQHRHRQERVLDQDTADRVTSVLRQVVERGTGTRARIGRPVAGKTGTGQEWRDAWFVGYTPELATAVWLGFAERGLESMVPPTTRLRVSGGTWPAEIWQLYMSAALAEVPVSDFTDPRPLPPPDATEEDALEDADDDPTLLDVRNVVGMPAEPAVEALTRAGFLVDRRDTPSDDYPPGYVAAQRPAGGDRAPGGSTVVIEVADGRPTSTDVPDVLGRREQDAVAVLRYAGFEAEVLREAEPPSEGSAAREGKVWKQNPAPGDSERVGTRVTIWVNPET